MKKILIILILIIASALQFKSMGRDFRDRRTQKLTQTITAGCLPASAEVNLDLNNVRALILAQGSLWEGEGKAEYEVPKGSGKTSLYAGGIWVGGVDINGQLRTCARSYRSEGNDYWPGPLISGGEGIASVSPDVCISYDKHYKITRAEVEDFVAYYGADAETRAELFDGYTVPTIITEWPARGPIEYGAYDYYLAPFQDVDGDGEYNPTNGDYPYYILEKNTKCNYQPERRAENLGNTSQKLFGDETIWWVYNDKGNVHTTTIGAAAIGMEFRAQGFAFSTNDELNNMTFYNYQIINRSTYSLTEAYFGVWNDPDLGAADDDKAGCDVVRGLGYVYNGDDLDGSGEAWAYGANPPAIGVDFFEGPYQDPDNTDNNSSWKDYERTELDCEKGYKLNPERTGMNIDAGANDINNGNINGLNFGDSVIDNERWGMRRFIYYVIGTAGFNGDPETGLQYYNYLKGYWKDGSRMTYGDNGYGGSVHADFLYPDDTDICGWGTNGVPQAAWSAKDDKEYDDMRIVQSAGPFTLEPGAVNDITVGVVWATANSTAWASVQEVRKADVKAQRLFENCFQLIDGPSAPDYTIIELDRKLIFHLSNTVNSNNYLETYREQDPFIDPSVTGEDRYYNFQGYQVYQLKDETVTMGEILNEEKARQVFQCDLKDGVNQIVNFVWDAELKASIPYEMVYGSDAGIVHSFELAEDAFGTGKDKQLVNYKEYYYMVIAYAYNNYDPYNPVDEGSLGNQTSPYLAGRKNILVKTAIPHALDAMNGGTVLSSNYGDVPAITMVDGRGNGANSLELSQETYQDILTKTAYPFKADKLTYKENYGPIKVKVIDPLNVIDAEFTLKFLKDSVNYTLGYFNSSDSSNIIPSTGLIWDTKYELTWEENGETKRVVSDSYIRYADEKLFPELGISVFIEQIDFPGQNGHQRFDEKDNVNNGFISASLTAERIDQPSWLNLVPDEDGKTPFNWIRCGRQTKAEEDVTDWSDYLGFDPDQVYEKVLLGTWAPYALTSSIIYGPANADAKPAALRFDKQRLPSIDFVITKDKSLWTRCPVIEMAENNEDDKTVNSLSEGGALRFRLRAAPSKNKEGVSAEVGAQNDTLNVDAPNYIGATGMSWFPGYAIDLETGERLNIMFGEDSWLVGENGNDMLWNPTANIGDDIYLATGGSQGNPYFGGKHYIYVVGHNDYGTNPMPGYDEGRTIYNALNPSLPVVTLRENAKKIWTQPAWVTIPTIEPGFEFFDYESMPDNDITIKLRIANPYFVNINGSVTEEPANDNYPAFTFSTSSLKVVTNNVDYGKSALDKINVVPNPYYGYSEYELTQLDNYVKITNLPERCIVSIYTVNGNLVRRFDKDNSDSFITWDIKNQYDVSIASGMYIIHINAPGLGEKVVKWFGSMRPIDLNAF
ncbi:MAG: hypothetical protein A2W95_13850 [Bacteroidetes bacterium GWA2_40_14]|nr:MAG: hypothetical protein A2W95_13850 [Bacteroidetes bacterium GWA2_40_14]